MPFVREKGTESNGADISDAAVRFLRTHLEAATPEATGFYIDAPTIEILAEDHAPSFLITRLRDILNRRDCVDVELIGASPPAEDEVPGVIDRRSNSENLAVLSAAADGDTENVAASAAAEVAEAEETDELEDAVFVGDHQLKCVVCKGEQFHHRRAQLHSAVASFFDVEWLGKSADCYVCNSCGYVHWFMR